MTEIIIITIIFLALVALSALFFDYKERVNIDIENLIKLVNQHERRLDDHKKALKKILNKKKRK